MDCQLFRKMCEIPFDDRSEVQQDTFGNWPAGYALIESMLTVAVGAGHFPKPA